MATGIEDRGTTRAAAPGADQAFTAGRWILVLGAALFAIALATVARDLRYWGTTDLSIYRRAGLTALHSGQMYTPSFGSPFTYPPFAALLFEILAAPWALVRWLMTGASLTALVVVAWVSAGAAGVRPGAVRAGVALVIAWAALWTDPVMSTLTWGQIDLVLMAVALADLCARDDRRWKGVGVGLAAGVKLTPGIFIPYLLLTRRYRAALVATTAFVATIVVSFVALPGQARQYWLGGLFASRQRVGYPDMLSDQSLDGVITRLAGSRYAWLAVVVIVGGCGLLLAARAHNRGLTLLGIVTCAVTGLLVSPISWDHHWVWIVPLPVAALALIRQRGPALGSVCLIALSALFLDYPLFGGSALRPGSALDGLIWVTGGNPDRWHGLQLITGNLYVLAGLGILCSVALVTAANQR